MPLRPRRTDLHPPHREDLAKSGITAETIVRQKIRSVPGRLRCPARVPGAERDHVDAAVAVRRSAWRLDGLCGVKVFPPLATPKGTTKYLQCRDSGSRLFFPVACRDRVLHCDEDCSRRGRKKSVAVSRQGLATVGFSGSTPGTCGARTRCCPTSTISDCTAAPSSSSSTATPRRTRGAPERRSVRRRPPSARRHGEVRADPGWLQGH